MIYFSAFILISLKVTQALSESPDIPEGLQEIYKRNLSAWKAPRNFSKALPYYLSGYDEQKRPIWVCEFGKWDIRSFIEKGEESLDTLDKYVDHTLLTIYNSSISKDNKTIMAIGIMDWDGFQESQLFSVQTMNFYIEKTRLIYFVMGHAYHAYLINVNFVARTVLDMTKPILGEEFAKVEVFGTNEGPVCRNFTYVILNHASISGTENPDVIST
ncbi:unnamed protein product [Allacma fusca]|uniref:CRAL-TRIO domain-containing protein n=1 Tax=Allacma fusca TaxID=39272 RepID=A0A8J2P620_9HEXA|nr:unnamed protein product [Allacma fusca]